MIEWMENYIKWWALIVGSSLILWGLIVLIIYIVLKIKNRKNKHL